jgi:hypothetical protein
LKFYADVHRSKRNGEGCRITYTTDGGVSNGYLVLCLSSIYAL